MLRLLAVHEDPKTHKAWLPELYADAEKELGKSDPTRRTTARFDIQFALEWGRKHGELELFANDGRKVKPKELSYLPTGPGGHSRLYARRIK